jgi:hypothetical protein
MRHSVKSTFLSIGGRKYTDIRVQKRFKYKKDTYFREDAGRHSPATSIEQKVLPVFVSHPESFVSRARIRENRDYEPPLCCVE